MITRSNLGAVTALALLAAFSLTDVACSTGADVSVPPPDTQSPAARVTDFELQDQLRSVWTDHASLMHVYVIEALANLPDTNRALDRLLQNQTDIGNALTPFYGLVRGETLAALLRDRALIAGDLISATKANDVATLAVASKRWFENGDRVAALFLETDPRIPIDIKALVHVQLDAILAQIAARADGRWAEAAAAQDRFLRHTNTLADVLGWSITTKFPDTIASSDLNPNAAQLYRDTRVMWREHAFWTRVMVIESIAGLPDTYMATNQLMTNQVAIGDAVKPFYGPAEGSRLTLLLSTHVLAMADYIDASKGTDPARIAKQSARLYANANDIAALYGKANPGTLSEYQMLWHRDIDHALNQITARFANDWANDLAAYDESIHGTRKMADTIAAGIVKLWPQAGVTIASQWLPQGPQAVQYTGPMPTVPKLDPPCTHCPYDSNLVR